ncbi:aquaporin [Bifidobacterium pullorum]|uniref:aquaporin n=1 Tax=Bifidobacterium pullorum TaxID=78448 RepID=UPI00320A5C7D
MTAVETTRPDQSQNALTLVLRVGGELVGSFLICLGIYLFSTIGLTLYGPYLSFVALATGLIYAGVTMMLAKVCQAQFNPAITVASMLVSKTRVLDGILFILAQVLGALAAGALVMRVILPTSDAVTVAQWMSYVNNGFDDGSFSYGQLSQAGVSFGIAAAIVVEVVAGMIIAGAAMRMTDEQGAPLQGYGLAMGVAYGACAAFAAPVTGAALNPARSTGIAVFSSFEELTQNPLDQLWVFWICPVLAAALVALPMIVVQMMRGSQTSRIEIVDADDRSDAGTESESEFETSVEDVTDADEDASDADASDADASDADDVRESADEHADAEVGGQQTDAQGDADEGVESH